jgi:hypothetical protein
MPCSKRRCRGIGRLFSKSKSVTDKGGSCRNPEKKRGICGKKDFLDGEMLRAVSLHPRPSREKIESSLGPWFPIIQRLSFAEGVFPFGDHPAAKARKIFLPFSRGRGKFLPVKAERKGLLP